MNTWTDIATIIGDLLTLATAAINLATTLQTRTGDDRNRQSRGGGRLPKKPR